MKSVKPKGKVPCLIGSTLGTPRKHTVERRSSCRRCDTVLEKGTQCFAIPQLGGSFANARPYCIPCFNSILEKTQSDLTKLVQESTQIAAGSAPPVDEAAP